MAKQDGMWIRGSFKSVVFYKLGDQHVARTKPNKVRKTKNMKRRNENFGRASSLAAAFRHALIPALPDPIDKKMQVGFTGAFSNWLKSSVIKELPSADVVPFVSDYLFAAGQPAWEDWLRSFKVSMETNAAILSFSLSSLPPGATRASGLKTFQLKISAATVNFESKQCVNGYHEEFEYTPLIAGEATELNLPISTPAGHISLIVATVIFHTDGASRTKKKLSPISRVVGASYEK